MIFFTVIALLYIAGIIAGFVVLRNPSKKQELREMPESNYRGLLTTTPKRTKAVIIKPAVPAYGDVPTLDGFKFGERYNVSSIQKKNHIQRKIRNARK